MLVVCQAVAGVQCNFFTNNHYNRTGRICEVALKHHDSDVCVAWHCYSSDENMFHIQRDL